MRYVPILKAKEGELGALQTLAASAADAIVPLMEVPEVPVDPETGEATRDEVDFLADLGFGQKMAKAWSHRFFVDVGWADSNQATSPLAIVLSSCRDANAAACPVVSTAHSNQTLAAASHHHRLTGSGVCIRLGEADFAEEVNQVEVIDRLMDSLGVDRTAADVVIDLKEVPAGDAARVRHTFLARGCLSLVPTVGQWRSLILAGTAFPQDLSEVDAASASRLRRAEWQVWTALVSRPDTLPRTLVYSDYGIAHPVSVIVDPRKMRMSASIRYTTDRDWLIVKGRNVRQYGFEQFFDLSQQIVNSPDYYGEGFSWGDQYIKRCAERQTGPGNATTWRKVGTSHHLTVVARQVASAVP